MGTPRVPWPLVWAVLQLGWWPGWLLDPPDRPWSPLTFSPAQLTVLEGENASFVCSLPNVPASFVLNWYRMSPRNQTDKLAAFQENRTQPGKDRRFLVARLPSGQDFRMTILTTRLNDSGVYLCGAIYLPPNTQISESPRAELTVRERALEPPTESPSPPPRLTGQVQGLVISVTSVLVGVLLLLLLLSWALAVAVPRATQGACGCQSEDEPLKEGPSEAPVFTVDYGELDFQWREKTPEPPAPCTPEQTEYATIVFPSRPGSPGPLPLRPEDGPCPWPL
ncbi:programmed cell death protein 1 isoform X1 [Suricata suricatta]|uniref:Programmed cell death 1 n=1 Tax=Suricata suricatta TaxID=37032 RepID=A0A673SPN3_SURSU|nr:programmed cell death protein 1 isoform X1 [Suricata suricatta]